MNPKKAVFFSLIIISQLSYSLAQNNRFQVNTSKGEVKLKLDNEIFSVDTINSIEEYIYILRFTDDSCYIRINPITNSTFTCCNDNQYILSSDTVIIGLTDRRGWIKGTKLYWREIKNGDFEFVYENVGENKLNFMNEIFDDIIKQLLQQY